MSYPVRSIRPVPTAIDRQIEALAAEQHGLIGHAQAIEVGATERAIRHGRESGRWLVHRPSVYRLPGTPRGWHVDLRAAVLAAEGNRRRMPSVGRRVALEIDAPLGAVIVRRTGTGQGPVSRVRVASASAMMRWMSSATVGRSSMTPTTWPLDITPRSGRPSTMAALSSMGVFAAITT